MGWIAIRLHSDDLRLVEQVGVGRQHTKDSAGVADQRLDHHKTSQEVHRLGFAAELAVAKLLEIPPDIRLGPKGNKSISLRKNNARISVEYNSLAWGDLRFEKPKLPKADYFVLVTGNIPYLKIVGWADRKWVLANVEQTWLPGQGKRWIVQQAKLRPPEELLFLFGLDASKYRGVDPFPETRERADVA